MATLDEIIKGTRDTYTVGRVFGDPIERDGVTIIPVATVAGGGGGGSGIEAAPHHDLELPEGAEGGAPKTAPSEGSGGGFGGMAKPAGVYVIKDGDVSFQPTVDVNKLASGAFFLTGIVVVFALLTRRCRRR